MFSQTIGLFKTGLKARLQKLDVQCGWNILFSLSNSCNKIFF